MSELELPELIKELARCVYVEDCRRFDELAFELEGRLQTIKAYVMDGTESRDWAQAAWRGR